MPENPRKRSVLVIYPFFAHYRKAILRELCESKTSDYHFAGCTRGEAGIAVLDESSFDEKKFSALRGRRILGLFWQTIPVFDLRRCEVVILLGDWKIPSYWLISIYCLITGRPAFFWTHGWTGDRQPRTIAETFRTVFYRLGAGLLLYGRRAGRFADDLEIRYSVIGNCLDYEEQRRLREMTNLDHSIDRVLFVGRKVASVDLGLLLKAVTLIPKSLELLIVGPGQVEQRWINSLPESVRVLDLPETYDEAQLASYFRSSKAVVSPGKIGLLCLHAMAYGVPPITHDQQSKQMPEAELIQHGENGFLFPWNDVRGMAQVISDVLNLTEAEWQAISAKCVSSIEATAVPAIVAANIETAIRNKYHT